MRPIWSILVIALIIAGLRFVPGAHLPSHPLWDFYNLPPIAKDLPWSFTERQSFLQQRIQGTFPSGTSRDDLLQTLRAQGFEIDEGSNEGRYGWIGFACLCLIMVEWRPDRADAYFWPFGLPDSGRPHPF